MTNSFQQHIYTFIYNYFEDLSCGKESNVLKLVRLDGDSTIEEFDEFVEKDDKKVNAKSIMGIMSLAISSGTEVTINAEGADAEQAVQALVALVSKEELDNQ